MQVSNKLWKRVDLISDTLNSLHDSQTRELLILHMEFLAMTMHENIDQLADQEVFLNDMLTIKTTHRIHPGIVGVALLTQVLNKIADSLPRNLQLTFVPEDDVWSIYKSSRSRVEIYDSALHLLVEVPLADKSRLINLY